MSLADDGQDYQVLEGNLRPIRSEIWAAMVELLPAEPPGVTIRELRGAWPDGMVAPSETTLLNTLLRCSDKAGVCRTEGKPARWWKATTQFGTLRSPEMSGGCQWN